jgi:hypothetical protein
MYSIMEIMFSPDRFVVVFVSLPDKLSGQIWHVPVLPYALHDHSKRYCSSVKSSNADTVYTCGLWSEACNQTATTRTVFSMATLYLLIMH